jgi:hypothetical protein
VSRDRTFGAGPPVFDNLKLDHLDAVRSSKSCPPSKTSPVPSSPQGHGHGLSLGLGNAPAAEVQIGGAGWLALFGHDVGIEPLPESAWGAMLAACLATNPVFHHMMASGEGPAPRTDGDGAISPVLTFPSPPFHR